jgi:TldD protein
MIRPSLLSRVKNGIFAKSFRRRAGRYRLGQVRVLLHRGLQGRKRQAGRPIKGATLIGDGPSVLTRVIGIGNDMALDEGVGVCGKGGQSVPAGVGQPTLLVEGLTVGAPTGTG